MSLRRFTGLLACRVVPNQGVVGAFPVVCPVEDLGMSIGPDLEEIVRRPRPRTTVVVPIVKMSRLMGVAYDREILLRIYERSGFLEAGGAYAWLLRQEVRTARNHLVPYLKWCEAKGLAVDYEGLDDFLDVFDPTAPLMPFYQQLKAGEL